MAPFVIAIDGPAASGKSTIARLLAHKHGWVYINSGQMYRAVAHFGLLAHLTLPQDEQLAVSIAERLLFSVEKGVLLTNGEDLSQKVSMPIVEKAVSSYAAISGVRKTLVNKQREIAKTKSVVMDGRDVGTVVFPDAQLKIFLVATAEVRAKRRFDEIRARYPNDSISYQEILAGIKQRDAHDQERDLSPLIMANDAILVDTSNQSINEVTLTIESLVKGVAS